MYFIFFSAVISLFGLGVIFSKNTVHSVLCLIMAFIGSGCLFIISGAEMLAMILIIVYVGAIAVLFLFVVMMLGCNKSDRIKIDLYGLMSLVVIGIIGFSMYSCFGKSDVKLAENIVNNVIGAKEIGRVVYTKYLFVFQIAGYILLAGMVGAIALTFERKREDKKAKCYESN